MVFDFINDNIDYFKNPNISDAAMDMYKDKEKIKKHLQSDSLEKCVYLINNGFSKSSIAYFINETATYAKDQVTEDTLFNLIIKNKEIDSYEQIDKINRLSYVPFIKEEERDKQLDILNQISNKGIHPDDLENIVGFIYSNLSFKVYLATDHRYTDSQIRKDKAIAEKQTTKKFQKILDALNKGVNVNSLMHCLMGEGTLTMIPTQTDPFGFEQYKVKNKTEKNMSYLSFGQFDKIYKQLSKKKPMTTEQLELIAKADYGDRDGQSLDRAIDILNTYGTDFFKKAKNYLFPMYGKEIIGYSLRNQLFFMLKSTKNNKEEIKKIMQNIFSMVENGYIKISNIEEDVDNIFGFLLFINKKNNTIYTRALEDVDYLYYLLKKIDKIIEES
jgi:hypothetical protein